MKISVIAAFAFLLIGCESSRQSASLTSQQAKTVAIQLANEKAGALYHCQPFQDGQPASVVSLTLLYNG
jgi:NifU-like protein involved in Fe-S cluster formation